MRFLIIIPLPNSRKTSDTEWPAADDAGGAHVIDVGRDPATMIEFKEVIACFVVSTNENSEVRGPACATVIGMKVAQLAEFHRNGHGVEIIGIADRLGQLGWVKVRKLEDEFIYLEVTADDEEINPIPAINLTCFLDRCVYGI